MKSENLGKKANIALRVVKEILRMTSYFIQCLILSYAFVGILYISGDFQSLEGVDYGYVLKMTKALFIVSYLLLTCLKILFTARSIQTSPESKAGVKSEKKR